MLNLKSRYFDPYGNRCIHACKPPYRWGKPCGKCTRLHLDAMEEQCIEHELKQEHLAILATLPATDDEWHRYLDDTWPLATALATEPELELQGTRA